MEAQSTLEVVAEISIAFMGFAGIVGALGGRRLTPERPHVWVPFWVIIEVGLGTLLVALLPMLLHHLGLPDRLVWASSSAFVAILVICHALFMGLRLAETTPGAGFFRIVIVEGLAYVTVWVAFPLALYYLCQAFGREERFIRTVVALNWATVLQIAIILSIDLLARSGLLPPPVGGFATFAATVYLFGYVWFVVRLALDVAPLPAAGVVVLDFMISSIVLLFAEAMLA